MGTAPATHSLTAPTVNALADGLNKGEFVPFYQPLGMFNTNAGKALKRSFAGNIQLKD